MSTDNKIAIVGLACRFPQGLNTPEQYWEALKEGRDVVSQIDESRFGCDFYLHPDKKESGKSYTFSAGVLDNIDKFDAAFFGISPREAAQMDPQQRLLLELTWEAIESAGFIAKTLKSSDTAVYIGIASNDYANRQLDDLAGGDAYVMTGNTQSIASNRISYAFDFQGPSMSIDTACSSALVAFHQACQSVLSGESSMAVAGGVNMLLHPFPFVGFSKASMLSPTGRCQAFGEKADGYVRSEGGAILLLKSLSQAEKDGDTIHAVVLSSGVNCDGHTSSLVIPGIEGQKKLLDKVYRKAGVDFDAIDYIEAHGTGTPVGDPIEAEAIALSIGKKRSINNPLPIGSSKANVGHLETASGMAGLFKIILSIKNKAIPASIHCQDLNPNIDFIAHNIEVNRNYKDLGNVKSPLVMGVNCFGFGGANAHVVLQEYKQQKILGLNKFETKQYPPLLLSAKTEEALKDVARQYINLLSSDEGVSTYNDIAWSAYHHRTWHKCRLLACGGLPKIIKGLESFVGNDDDENIVTSSSLNRKSKLAFVFSGNGCQWQGMGQSLLKSSAVFRRSVEQVNDCWQKYSDVSLIEEFNRSTEDSNLALTEIAQPLLFAFQVGVIEILRKQGLQATAVMGHSAGEVAAAWAAGILTLPDAIHVIYERSHAQTSVAKGSGTMAVVALSQQQIVEEIKALDLEGDIEVAAINSPKSVSLSGKLDALKCLGAALKKKKKFLKMLDLDYAFHSKHMDSGKKQVMDKLAGLQTSTENLRFISTVTGSSSQGCSMGASYWWDNIRQPVEFVKAINTLVDDGFDTFVEIGPHPIVGTYIQQCLKDRGIIGNILPTIKKGQESSLQLVSVAYKALLCGVPFDEKLMFPEAGQYTTLPSYPWQRERYWIKPTEDAYDFISRKRIHPLLGYRLKEHEAAWENQLDATIVPYLADHVVSGVITFPATAYIEMALESSKQWFGDIPCEIENLEIHSPLVLEKSGLKIIQLILNASSGHITIQSKERLGQDKWTVNAVARLLGNLWKKESDIDIEKIILSDQSASVSHKEHYKLTKKLGLEYGEAFQGVNQVWCNDNQVVAELDVPTCVTKDISLYNIHPVLLDSSLQCLFDILDIKGQKETMIPIQVGKLRLYQPHRAVKYAFAEIKKYTARSLLADLVLLDKNKRVIAELDACRSRSINLNLKKTTTSCYVFDKELQPRQDMLGHVSEEKKHISNKDLCSVISNNIAVDCSIQRAEYFNSISPLLDVLVTSYVYEAFIKTGIRVFSLKNLIEDIGFNENYRYFILYLLGVLEEEGLVVKNKETWELLDNDDLLPSSAIWQSIMEDAPSVLAEMVLLGRCGNHLYDVLVGEISSDALLHPEKSGIYEHWLDSSVTFEGVYASLQMAIQIYLKDWPESQRIRIAVYGALNATWIENLILSLPVNQFDLLLLDKSDYFVNQVNTRYKNYPNIESYSVSLDGLALDGIDPFSKGFFDLIILNQCLSGSEDLSFTLNYLNQQLSPIGKLLAIELQPSRFSDITLGLQHECWHYDEEIDSISSDLMFSYEWESLLNEQGYQDVISYIEPEDVTRSGAVLYIASAGERVVSDYQVKNILEEQKNETWLVIADNSTPFSSALSIEFIKLLDTYNIAGHSVDLSKKIDGQTSFDSWFNDARISIDRILYIASVSNKEDVQPIKQCSPLINLVQSITRIELDEPPQLNLLTFNSGFISPSDTAPSVLLEQSTLWGIGRVIMNEHSELSCRLIEWQGKLDQKDISENVLKEITTDTDETEVILCQNARYVTRMRGVSSLSDHPDSKHFDVSLDFISPGQFKNLYWKKQQNGYLADDEVEIQPKAVGLNFRDVMYSMGLLADEAVENGFAGASLGLELAGTITRIGKKVSHYKVGDDVIGFAPACFSSKVITKPIAVAHKPVSWSFEEAATVPTTFFTAYYALRHLAQMESGESILIHGASGGVGLAAIQIAQHLGLTVFATAGTDEKRDFVAMLGADYVMDSRSLGFADEVMQITKGGGVDAVLNVISGEAINRNLSILKPFGRFLEIGKRDFYENSRIGLRPFRNNISYFGIDADQLLIQRPSLATRLFKEVMALFDEEILKPLPYRKFPAYKIKDAFEYMQKSRQIGKVVVSFQAGYPKPSLPNLNNTSYFCRKQATYLITGGLSGFGFKTAEWFVSRGAESLVLASRAGKAGDSELKVINKLRKWGVSIQTVSCDVSNIDAVENLIGSIQRSDYPLGGVVHAAMVLEDTFIQNMSNEQLERVFSPKISGAWNLHKAVEAIDLDCFLLYSSATTFLGNSGQANYVAANSFLEALVNYRRMKNQTANFVAWGAIDDAGYLTKNQETKAALHSITGRTALKYKEALEILDSLLTSNYNGVAIINFDWTKIKKFMPSAISPKYEEQIRLSQSAVASLSHEDIHTLIDGLSEKEVIKLVSGMLQEEVSQILHQSKDAIDINIPVSEIGMDSLMGMELVAAVDSMFKLRLPVMLLTEGASINKIAMHISNKLINTDENDEVEDGTKEIVERISHQQGVNITDEEVHTIVHQIDGNSQ